MKSARERAEEAAALAGFPPKDQRNRPFVDAMELSFEEHARDQRVNCASALDRRGFLATQAETLAIVRDAPAPGEKQ